MEHDALKRKAMKAYLKSRVYVCVAAAVTALMVCGVLCVWSGLHLIQHVSVCVAVALCGVCAFYGRQWGWGAKTGMWVGAASAVLSLSVHPMGHAYSTYGVCVSWCMLACVLGGVGAGYLLYARAPLKNVCEPAYYVPAVAMALLMQTFACACVGFMSVFACVVALGFFMGWHNTFQPFLESVKNRLWR